MSDAVLPSGTLSFEQIVRAGRPAWHESAGYCYRFDPDCGGVSFCGPVDCPGTYAWQLSSPDRRAPKAGWRHASGCTCSYCEVAEVGELQ